MASFVDLFKWTVSGKTTRREDFLSGCLALTARHNQRFARELVRLLAPEVRFASSAPVLVGFQEAALHRGQTGGRTDCTLEVDGHRVVVECKVGNYPLDEDVLRRYRASTRPPRTVVALVETPPVKPPASFRVTRWESVAALLLSSTAFRRGVAGELLHLLQFMGLATLDELPSLDRAGHRRALKLIARCDSSVRSGLAALFADPATAKEFSKRTALDEDEDSDESWSVPDVGWVWWGASSLKGTRLKGLELAARRSNAARLEWSVELLASHRRLRDALPKDAILPWESRSEGWVAARLGDLGCGSFHDALAAALAKTALLLRTTEARYPDLGLRLKRRISLPRSASAPAESVDVVLDAIDGTGLFERTGVSLGTDLVRQVRQFTEPRATSEGLKTNPLWSREGRSPRFYLRRAGRNVVGMGLNFREDKKPGRRFKAWLWASRSDARGRIAERARTEGLGPSLKNRNVWIVLGSGDADPDRSALPALAERLAVALCAGTQ